MAGQKVKTEGSNPRPAGVPTWSQLERGLAATIDRMATTTYLIITVSGTGSKIAGFQGGHHFVQFAQGGNEGFRAETVSNRFLAGNDRLTPTQERQLLDLGWIAPDPNPRDSQSTVNWYREWPQPPPGKEIARLAVKTLRQVWGVSSSSQLRYRCFDDEGRDFAQPLLPIKPEPRRSAKAPKGSHRPPTLKELRPVVEAALKEFIGTAELVPDKDGDFSLRFGSATVFVRIMDEPTRVRVFAPILWGVTESPELLKAVNEINLRVLYGRLVWSGQAVIMAMDVPAARIGPEDIAFACFEVGSAADHFDEGLQRRFGGKSINTSKAGPEQSGYL